MISKGRYVFFQRTVLGKRLALTATVYTWMPFLAESRIGKYNEAATAPTAAKNNITPQSVSTAAGRIRLPSAGVVGLSSQALRTDRILRHHVPK